MTDIIVPGADFSATAIGYAPAVRLGLEYLNFFNSEANLARNLAPNKPAATVVGSPSQGIEYAAMVSESAYVQTEVSQTADFTWFAVAAADAEIASFLIGNLEEGVDAGAWLWCSNFTAGNGTVQPTFATKHNSGSPTLDGMGSGAAVAAPMAPKLLVCSYNGTTQAKTFDNLTDETSNSKTVSTAALSPAGSKLRIGSAVDSATPGEVRMHYSAMYSRVLSSTEQAAMAAQIRAYYAARSITL